MTAVVHVLIDPREAQARLYRGAAHSTRRICVVPEDISVTDWCARERILPETSASPGAYDPSVVPYARRWQDLGADPATGRMVLCWASQTTKSTVIENIIAFRIVHMPTPMVIVQPKIDAAEAWAKERFVPMVRSTPALRGRVRLGRSTDSTLRYKRFPGGFAFIASAQSATELASRSAPFIASDETDRMEMIPGEGNPVMIVDRRQGSSDIGLHIMTSTPRDAETTIIWPYLEAGTFELYFVPCPHCGQMQPLFWDGLRWDHGRPATAHYVCGGIGAPSRDKKLQEKAQSPVLEAFFNSPLAELDESGRTIGCGAVIEEREKPEMLTRGEWRALNAGAGYPSSHLHGLYSPFAKSNWASLASEFDSARGKKADLQVVVNTRFAETWHETADVLSSDMITDRLEPMEEGIVPAGVGVLTVGGDVQANRIELDVWGWGAGLESWLIASTVLVGDPADEASQPGGIWDLVDEALSRSFKHVSGREVPIAAALIDSGYQATQVYRFTHRRRARKIFASKGVGGEGLPILGKPTVQTKDRVVLYPIGVDAAKTQFLRSQLLQAEPGPGYVHFPDWLTTDQCKQYVSEKRVRRVQKGQLVWEWHKRSADEQNERLDCRNYARAALELFGARAIATIGARAAALAEPLPAPAPVDPNAKPAENEDRNNPYGLRQRKGGGWLKRSGP